MLTQVQPERGKPAAVCGHNVQHDLNPVSDGHNVIAWHACIACGHTWMTIGEAKTRVERGALR